MPRSALLSALGAWVLRQARKSNVREHVTAHSQIVHQAAGVEAFGRFVNRGRQRATMLRCLFHGAFPQLFCDVASLARCARLRVVGFRSTRRRVWTKARRTALIRVW